MQIIYSLACYQTIELNVYQNRSTLNATTQIAQNIIDANQNLQKLCGSALSSPITVTILDANQNSLIQAQILFSIFPASFQLGQIPKESSPQFGNQIILKTAVKIQFTVDSVILFSSAITRVNILESLEAEVVTVKKSNTALIVGVVIGVILLATVIILSIFLAKRHQKQQVTNNKPKYSAEYVTQKFDSVVHGIFNTERIVNTPRPKIQPFRGTSAQPLRVNANATKIVDNEPDTSAGVEVSEPNQTVSQTESKIDIHSFLSLNDQIGKTAPVQNPLKEETKEPEKQQMERKPVVADQMSALYKKLGIK
ncbi:Hypothetical_protein [Hexamita inflata]|uniref:Hypothetical_protein n=1 Tax=Hexamita inflata TaxID=28002 RepID=A0AA86PXJ4_9EUKA|nr:Hypothetical protein HINF_LOCUS35825 [Hexamita inflata]